MSDRQPASRTTQAEWRLRAYPVAVLVTIGAAVLVSAISAGSAAAPADAVGGDYPAFFGAGKIAAEGDWDQLYAFDRQVEAQSGLHAADDGPVAWYFAYPPQVALAYQPAAALDYHWSYLGHTLLMAIALLAAVALARPMIPWLSGRVLLATSAAMVFWPMFRAVTGGSNTALTLLVVVAAWRLIHDDHPFLAGLALSLLFYKPQFAVPLIGLFLLGRYWKVVAGASAGSLAFYLSGVPLLGWAWVGEWLEAARWFGPIDADLNGHSAISFIGFGENLFGPGGPGVVISWMLALAVAAFLSWLWWRGSRVRLAQLLAITMPGILLLSLHAMSHDGAMVMLSVAVVVGFAERRDWVPWVVAIWVLGATQIFIKGLGFSPGLPMLLIVMVMAHRALRSNSVGPESETALGDPSYLHK